MRLNKISAVECISATNNLKCFSQSKAITLHLKRMQTTCRYTVHADLLTFTVCMTACLCVWMTCRAGWLLTNCSLTTLRLRCSGAYRHLASTKSQVVPFVLEEQLCNLYPPCETVGSCWVTMSTHISAVVKASFTMGYQIRDNIPSCRASPPVGQYEITLHGDRGM